MTEGKHTEGPWIIATSCSWRRIVTEGMEPVCIPVVQRSDNHPDLHFPNGGSDGPDARLIAAAPDLLEALKAFERIKDLWLPESVEPEHIHEAEVLHKARSMMLAAIAKVEGEDNE